MVRPARLTRDRVVVGRDGSATDSQRWVVEQVKYAARPRRIVVPGHVRLGQVGQSPESNCG